jgi:hypothetical protein
MFAVGHKRKDVVQATGQSSLLQSGFMDVLPWSGVDAGASMEMFSVDERNRRLYSISRIP